MARVAVVGAGATGLTAAVQLARRGHLVTVFESGPFPAREFLDVPFTEDLRRSLIRRYRRPPHDRVVVETSSARVAHGLGWTSAQVGGGATVWGGLAYQPPRQDFRLSTHVREGWRPGGLPPSLRGGATDWPVDVDDFECWLAEAACLLGIQTIGRTVGADDVSYPLLVDGEWRFEPISLAETALARWGLSEPRRLRDLWPWRYMILAERLGVRIHALSKVAGLEMDRHLRCARAIEYFDASGRRRRAHFDLFILACGAIQSVRLLLLSGFDVRFDRSARLLGRYMTFHLFGPRTIVPTKSRLHQPPLISWRFRHVVVRKPRSATSVLPGGFVSVHSSSPPSGGWATDVVDQGTACLDLRFTGQDLPFYANRVVLDHRWRDEFGLPVARVLRRVAGGADEVHARLAREIRRLVAKTGLRVSQESTFDDDWLRIGDHQMGGCRMADSADMGVTRVDGRMFGLENVYVVDASTFPTALSVPPTWPAVANALRIARGI